MIKRSIRLLYAGFIIFMAIGAPLLSQSRGDAVSIVTTSELREMLAVRREILLVNTLSPLEFNDAAIPGSINLPYEHLREGRAALPGDLDTPILFYCQGIKCTKAPNTASLAVSLGYRNVYLYREGISGWMKAGNPVISRQKISYRNLNTIKPSTLYHLLEKNNPPLVLDVRDRGLFDSWRMDKGEILNIRMVDLMERFVEIPTNRRVVVVCHKGIQSIKACSWLSGKGINVVGMLEGGLEAWEASNLPTLRAESETGEPTI